MRTRVFLAAAILLAMALAGCAEQGLAGGASDTPIGTSGDLGNQTQEPAQNSSEPSPSGPEPGTFILRAPVNVTFNTTFQVGLDFYHAGNEPEPPVFGPANETGNETGNGTGKGTGNATQNRTVIDPGDPGTPAYYDDVFWTLDVELGNLSLAFNGTSVPAVVELALNQTGNATLSATYTRENQTYTAEAVVGVLMPLSAAGGSDLFPWEETQLNAVSCIGCNAADEACAGMLAGQSGADCVLFELPEGAAGRAFSVTSDFPLGDPDAQFYETCGGGAGPLVASEGSEEGIVPEGYGCLMAWEFVGAGSSITLRIE